MRGESEMLKNQRGFFILILIVISVLPNLVFAKCSEKFDKIDANCIRKYATKMKSKKIFVLSKNSEELKGNTYFFQTEKGSYGKFFVRSAILSNNECSIFLDVTTYIGKRAYNPSGTLSIKKEYDSWNFDRSGFDESSGNDFSLSRDNGKCLFRADDAKVIFYKNTMEQSLLTGSTILMYAGYFLAGLSVFLIAFAVFKEEDKFKAQETLEDAEQEDQGKDVPNDPVLKYSRPFFRRYFSPIVQGMKNKKKLKEKYKRKLASSGMTKHLTPEDFFAFKLFLIIGFPILFIMIRQFLEETWPMSILPVLSAIGFFYPDIWINGKITKRSDEMIQNMPFIVDMLALSVEAGLDFMAAMQKVIEKAPPSPLVDEFEILIKETKVGASRAEGLRQLSWRCNTLPISSFCATLIAADAVGASIGPILKTLAAELRQKRSSEAEKKGATAATKILFPMMMFIMPAVFIIIGAPIILQFVGGQ